LWGRAGRLVFRLKFCPYHKAYCAPIRQMHMLAQKVIELLHSAGHAIKLAFLPYRELIECDQRKDWWQVLAMLRCAASDSPYTASVCLSMLSLPCCQYSNPLAGQYYSHQPVTPGGSPMTSQHGQQQFVAPQQQQQQTFAPSFNSAAGHYYSAQPQSPIPTIVQPSSANVDVKMEETSDQQPQQQSSPQFFVSGTPQPVAKANDFVSKQTKSHSQPSYLSRPYKYGGNGRSVSFGTTPQAATNAVAAVPLAPVQENKVVRLTSRCLIQELTFFFFFCFYQQQQPFVQQVPQQQTSPSAIHQFVQTQHSPRNLTPNRTRSPSAPFHPMRSADPSLGETPVTQAVAKILTAKYGRNSVDGSESDDSMDESPSAPGSSTTSRDGSPLHRHVPMVTSNPQSPHPQVYVQSSQQAMQGGFGTFDSNLNQVSILTAPHFVNVAYANGLSEDDVRFPPLFKN